MFGGGLYFAGPKGFCCAFKFLQRFGWDAELADGNGGYTRGRGGRFKSRAKNVGRIERHVIRDHARSRNIAPPNGTLCPNIGSQKKQCEEAKDWAVHVVTLTASHHQEQVHRSVLEAEESADQRILRSAVCFASSGETKKVAALFGDLRVIVCKSGLRAGINIKKFLTALSKITGADGSRYSGTEYYSWLVGYETERR